MSSGPAIKEFLYVDVDRVRSLLSQLAGGYIEEIRSTSGSEMSGQAQAAIFGIGASGNYGRSNQYEEARSLQDLTFVAFERLANEHGFIADLPVEALEPAKWQSGAIHALLAPGQLFRAECPVQLIDGGFFDKRVQRLIELSGAIVKMQDPPQLPKNATARQKKEALGAIRAAAIGGISPDQLNAISAAVQSFFGDSVVIRAMPCGPNYLDYAFTGALLGRKEYIQEERENLFSRYGQTPTSWTIVFQIAAVPDRAEGEPEFEPEETVDAGGSILRSNMEKMVAQLLEYMEQLGVVEGPRWPSVSVTPLGLYRTVPRAS